MGTRKRRAIKAALHLSRRIKMKFSELPIAALFQSPEGIAKKISARKYWSSLGGEVLMTKPASFVLTTLAHYASHHTAQSYLSAGLLRGKFRGRSLQSMKRERRYAIGSSPSELRAAAL